ncbi:MAG: hypothetical protein RSD81_21910 [Pseudomonas sp.]
MSLHLPSPGHYREKRHIKSGVIRCFSVFSLRGNFSHTKKLDPFTQGFKQRSRKPTDGGQPDVNKVEIT